MPSQGWFPPVSRPRRARGGIKARSQRGSFASSWWARRWIQVLEGFDIGARLARGRSYARGGQVLDIAIEKGLVKARVQGSRARPYEVAIAVKTLGEAEWAGVVRAVASQALFASKLLGGEMPEQIEEVFQAEGVTLFPGRRTDLQTDCSCPDWSNPCKHVAAVFYLLGEEFDRDPFLIFRMRGMERDELVAAMTGLAATADAALEDEPAEPEPLPESNVGFWTRPVPPTALVPVEPLIPAALARRAGPLAFWTAERPLPELLEPLYLRAAAGARELLSRDFSALAGTSEPSAPEARRARTGSAARSTGPRRAPKPRAR